jgi:biofilm protein TabA
LPSECFESHLTFHSADESAAMIFDHISNLETYRGVDPDIYAGLKYLAALTPDVALGEYQVNANVKALVTSYDTKVENEQRYEAHTFVIDVQFPIVGLEGIEWSLRSGMREIEAYDAAKDRTMYTAAVNKTTITIGNGFFAVFWPNDAHNPQRAAAGKAETIKKVTLKVKVK